jgi:hypothetical protein
MNMGKPIVTHAWYLINTEYGRWYLSDQLARYIPCMMHVSCDGPMRAASASWSVNARKVHAEALR